MPNYTETMALIDELANLPNGWRYGEGVAIKLQFVEFIKKLIETFQTAGLQRFNIFAGLDGGFIVRTYFEQYFFEISVSADEGFDVSIEDKDNIIVFEENTTPAKIADVYSKFLEICHLSELSTKETTTTKQENLVHPYSNEGQIKVFPPSRKFVHYPLAEQYANISSHITRMSSAPRPSTTSFQKKSQIPLTWGTSQVPLEIFATETSTIG